MASTVSTREQTDFAGLEPAELERFLYQMILIRRFEDKAGEMYTKGKVRGFLHLYTGQEACAVGAINALREQDAIFTHYRDHGHALARGLEPGPVMAELYGRSGGVSGGRGGSMHLYDTSRNFLGGYAIVTAHLPLAVGWGLASKMKGEDGVTMCIFGDGAIGEGEFHESINLAKLWDIPVVWFCENNLFGMGVPLKESLAAEITELAEVFKTPAVQVDGMDVIAVYKAMKEAVEHCSSGKGPYFIEALTYRYKGHSMADPELYRQKAELETYRQRDAIARFKDALIDGGIIDDARFDEIAQKVEDDVAAATEFAEQSPPPALSTLHDHIYHEPKEPNE